MEWLKELRSAVETEYGAAPAVATLAVVDGYGLPSGRSVVCRRINEDGSVWVASDARSQKNSHLRRHADAELVLWLPKSRVQFRLFCRVDLMTALDGHGARRDLWRCLTDTTRAMFFWPHPGQRREQGAESFRTGAGPDEPVPDSFEVLVLSPLEVDRLDLNGIPHARRRWREDEQWRGAEINP